MIIKVLMENTTFNSELLKEHGLSLYIKTANHNILFDTGQTAGFLDNAKKLNVNLSDIDTVIISHGHYDHGGGLKAFLMVNNHANVYIQASSFSDLYSKKNDGKLLYIGLDKTLMNHEQVNLLTNNFIIDEELELMTTNNQKYNSPSMNKTLMIKKVVNNDVIYQPDDFIHEQNLIIHEDDKQVLIAGCAHKGIMNILDSFHQSKGNYPTIVLSGFHLASDRSGFIENKNTIQTINDYFKQTTSLYYTGHCTGKEPFDFFESQLGTQIQYMYTGRTINI